MATEPVFVKLTSAGTDTGPFRVYLKYVFGPTTTITPLHNIDYPISKDDLLAGIIFNVTKPVFGTNSIIVESVEGYSYPFCTNSISSSIFSTTTTTTTTTTSTSTTTTTPIPALVPIYWNFLPNYVNEEFKIVNNSSGVIYKTKNTTTNTTTNTVGIGVSVGTDLTPSEIIYVPYNAPIIVTLTGRSEPIYGVRGSIIGYDKCGIQISVYSFSTLSGEKYVPDGTYGTITYSFYATLSNGYNINMGHYYGIF